MLILCVTFLKQDKKYLFVHTLSLPRWGGRGYKSNKQTNKYPHLSYSSLSKNKFLRNSSLFLFSYWLNCHYFWGSYYLLQQNTPKKETKLNLFYISPWRNALKDSIGNILSDEKWNKTICMPKSTPHVGRKHYNLSHKIIFNNKMC